MEKEEAAARSAAPPPEVLGAQVKPSTVRIDNDLLVNYLHPETGQIFVLRMREDAAQAEGHWPPQDVVSDPERLKLWVRDVLSQQVDMFKVTGTEYDL